jgi:hypothetical protein
MAEIGSLRSDRTTIGPFRLMVMKDLPPDVTAEDVLSTWNGGHNARPYCFAAPSGQDWFHTGGDWMLLPADIPKIRRNRSDLLRAAKAALRYLRRPERSQAKGLHRDEVLRRLEEAIKAAEWKRVKRRPKMPPFDENIVI